MQRYVLGFVISGGVVLLIEKQRPAWQKGKLNGVGGKVEPGEEAIQAMVREFREETGVQTPPGMWTHFATLYGEGYEVLCYVSHSFRNLHYAQTKTDEKLVRASASYLPDEVIHNIPYLVPMALDSKLRYPVELRYK